MEKCLFLIVLILSLTGCGTSSIHRKGAESLPQYSYLDGIRTKRTIACSSKKALHCMACALQGEAANQPAQGIYAVGVTIMTRAKGQLGQVCSVTKARRQFEGIRKQGKRKISRKVWGVSEHIIQSRETGWTHFWAPKVQYRLRRSKPHWAHQFERRQCQQKQIGDHIFYNTQQCRRDRYMRINAQNQ